MTKPQLLYTGFDGLDIAFQGALPQEILDVLEEAKSEAQQKMEPALREIGPDAVPVHVLEKGAKGGFRYILSTGPVGARYLIKANTGHNQWNLLASPTSAMLLQHSLEGTWEQLKADLEALGATIGKESINRVDFAMDFLMPSDFELNQRQFVSHPHTKLRDYPDKSSSENDFPRTVHQGRKLKTVMVGTMPGRQIVVYDKRLDAIEKRKDYWFDVWGIDRNDTSKAVWRVEARAGKTHLKERWNLRTFQDVKDAIGDVLFQALSDIRYIDDGQLDHTTNISRAALHPLWIEAKDALSEALKTQFSGILPGKLIEHERRKAEKIYQDLINGNCPGLAVTLGLGPEEAMEKLPSIVARSLSAQMKSNPERFRKQYRAAQDRLRFLT